MNAFLQYSINGCSMGYFAMHNMYARGLHMECEIAWQALRQARRWRIVLCLIATHTDENFTQYSTCSISEGCPGSRSLQICYTYAMSLTCALCAVKAQFWLTRPFFSPSSWRTCTARVTKLASSPSLVETSPSTGAMAPTTTGWPKWQAPGS